MSLSESLPPLAEFLRWLAEMPPAFRNNPEGFVGKGQPGVRVAAVVADLYESVAGRLPEEEFLNSFRPEKKDDGERNRLRWVLFAAYLLWHEKLRGQLAPAQNLEARLRKLLLQELSALSVVSKADVVLSDEERREELIRRVLGAFELRFTGESAADAADRLKQIDSVERQRLHAELKKRQEKLRKEEELRRKAEEEAASKSSRE